MNTRSKFVELVEMVNSITIALMMLTALKIVLNGIGQNYTMIFSGVLTDAAIEEIVKALSISVPMAIGSWTVYFLVHIWCKAKRKIEEERS